MLRSLSIASAFVMLLGAGFTITAWPHSATAAKAAPSSDEILIRAYDGVKTGMPVSQLGAAGLDTAKAEKLSKLALVERFMPKNSVAFDALDPAVRACYAGPGACDAYIFTGMGAIAVLLVEDGRVTWKSLVGVSVADNRGVRGVAGHA